MNVFHSFDKDFIELLKSVDQRFLEREYIDSNSLDVIKRFKDYHQDHTQIISDENSNIGNDIHPSHRRNKVFEGYEKLNSLNLLYESIKAMMGVNVANNIFIEILSKSILINDLSNIDLPYCIAISSHWLMREGRSYFTSVPNVEPSSSKSYMNMITETIFDLSSEFMGATVIFDVLIGLAYYTKYERDLVKEKFNYISQSFNENLTLEEMNYLFYLVSYELMTVKRNKNAAIKMINDYIKTREKEINVDNNKQAYINILVDLIMKYNITNILQSWVHVLGNKFRYGYQSVFTNLNLYSPRVLMDEFDYYKYPNGQGVEQYLDEIIEVQKIFSEFFSDGIKDKNNNYKVVAMPVVTLIIPKDKIGINMDDDLLKKEDEFIKYTLTKFSKYNNINIYRGIKLAMCCRLILDKQNNSSSQINTFGVKMNNTNQNDAVGSLRVATIGLANAALEARKNINEFFTLLSKKLFATKIILLHQRDLIAKRVEEKFYNLSKTKWINFEKLSSTIGVLGLFECVKLLSNGNFADKYTDEELELADKIITFIYNYSSEICQLTGYNFNVEFPIPGESMCFRFYERDLISYKEDAVKYNEYSNQLFPLHLKDDINLKLSQENAILKNNQQTGITHINIDGEISKEQNLKLHQLIWQNYPNIDYYAFNQYIRYCRNGHPTTKITNKCPKCDAEIVDVISRTVGYFKSVEVDFGKKRREEFKRRHFFNNMEKIGLYKEDS